VQKSQKVHKNDCYKEYMSVTCIQSFRYNNISKERLVSRENLFHVHNQLHLLCTFGGF